MATYRVTAPDGGTYQIEGPDDATDAQVAQAVLAKFPNSNRPPAPPDETKSGFFPALQAGFKGLKGDAAALAAKTGLMDIKSAEDYIAKQREESAKIFQPTEDDWSQSPLKKLKELAGGSAAYMAAPALAGVATLALPATIAPAVATGIGMGLTGLVSGAQFTGSNLTRKMEEGSSLADAELGSAALAAIPQAALDVLSLKMIPGVRGIFGAAGKKMTAEEAEAIATQGLKRTVADYALSTGKTMGVEGLTEAGQQVFERLQAGLSLTDEKAQKEYLDSFLGGAALGGAMAPVGRYFERGREQREAEVVGAMPGQRPGESLADAAQRLKNEIDEEKLNLLPPPAPPPPPVSPILNEQDLNNLSYGQIPAYIGTLQALPQTPEIRAAIKAANTASLNDTEGVVNDFLLKKLDEASRSLQPQAEGAGDLSFLPADLSTVISAQLANSIGFVQNKSKTNIFDQIVGKDISNPEQAAAVIDILNKYKAGVKPGATSQNIDTFIESIPFFKPVTPATQGTVNVGTTDTAPGGESTVLASEPGAGSTTPGVAATQPDGMVSTGQDVTGTVGGEAAAPPSVEEMSLVGPSTTAAERQPSMLKEREAFGKATGAVRGAGGWNLSGRVNQPAAKAVMLEDTPGVLSALSKSKNVFTQKIAELASLIPGLKTRINPEASEQEDYSRRTADQNTVVAHTMHINQLDAMRELKPIVEQLPNDMDHVPYKLLSPYVLLPKDVIIDDLGNGNHEITLREFQRGETIVKKSFLNTLAKLEEETKELGEDRLRQSIGRVISKRTAIAGSFDRSTNTVEIQSPYFAKDENILTHEYTHAITSYSIDNPTAEQKPIVRKLQKLFEHVKENLGKVREEVNPLHNKQYANTHKPYGLTNIHEFVSEAWGNPDFQYWLSKIAYEKTTAWSKFVETIAQLLGIKDSNALTEAIALSEELVTAAKTGTEAQEKEYFSKRKPKEAAKEAKPPAELSEVEKQDLAAIEAFKAEGPARIAEKTEQFKNILSKMLNRMGLKDVAVKIMDDIESKKYEGSYSAKLIKIALDADKPVRTLRHEAIHALKELGFFSESQWKALTKQANDGWIDTYLKTRNEDGNPLKEGEKSRYDAYMERPEFKSDPNAIIEEAIADAFGDFDTSGAPPGMLKAILNRLISLFDAIKSALQGNGIYTSEQAARQIFGKIARGELKAPSRGGSTTSGTQSGVQSGTQQGEASEQARSGEPALRPGDRGGQGSDGGDEGRLSIRGGRSEPPGDGGGRDKSGNDTPLAGAPTVQGGGPNPELVAVAEKYAKKYGIPYKRQSEYVELNVDRAKRLAKAYLAMPNNPEDPKVKEAYADMIRQVQDQYDALSDSGYKFTFFDGETDPYDGNAWNAMRDLRANKTMAVYGTYDGYGTTGITEQEILKNPMLADTGLLWEDQNGIERMVTKNDLFRAVHDAFGHGLEGAGFRAQGEENAWQAHAKLFYGPALKALTSETRGQNSEVNYGPNGEKNRKAKVFETAFADQKVGLMPDWTWKEGISKDEPVFQELDSRKDAKMFRNAVDRVKRGREYAFPLHVHDLETYQDARLFLSEDKESGFALIGDEIGSFFSGGGGQAYPTLRLAVEEGGRRIDAYRTKLPSVLGKAQFRPVARVEFNPEMATELWDFQKFKEFQNGNPDLVFYAYDPSFNPKGDLSAGDKAVAQTPLVEYDQAVELQVAATKYSLRGITLGTKQPDSVAFSGVHYGKAKTDTLDALKYGTGLRGAESRRLETHWDDRIKKRVYFYIAKPDGTMPLPESGLGGYVYTQTFDNLAPPAVVSRLYSEARGDANTMESLIVDAGYDGYAVPKMGMMVVLNHNTPVEYQGTKAEYESKKQEKLSLRSIPLSTRGIMEANDAFARNELGLKTKAVRNRFNKVRDIAIALNRETLENQGQMNRKELTTDDLNTISRALADEVSYQLASSSKTGTGLGWYSNNYPKAVKQLSTRFPELGYNRHAQSVFSAIVAVTSNGEKVTKNISNAVKLYAKLRDGKPLVAMGNRRATALINNLKQIEVLLAKHGENFEQVLKKEVTVADMNAYLRSIGKKSDASYLANTRIPAAAIYFGPKLGAFYANLSGSEGYLTMDLWWSRTFNRMRGLLIPQATDASIDKFRELIGKPNATRDDILAEAVPLRDKYKEYGFNTELEHLVGKKEPTVKAEKAAWEKKARVVAEDAFDQLMYENRLEKMANTIYKNEYEMLEEAPFGSSDRKFMYDAARRTQKLLQEEKINLSLADIQAALWYYEKRLYGKLSGKKADDIGYEEAIIKQSSEGSGRPRPSVVFDRGVNTGNVAAGESGTPDESGGVPAGSTEKLSLRSTWRASANAAIDRTSVARIEEGWASRLLSAISPKHFSEYRQVWLNRYNQLGVYDKQRADRMGGFGLLADASSEAAAMMSDYGAGLTAAVFSKSGGVPVFANGMTTVSTLNGTIKGPLEIFSVLTKLGKGDPDIYRAYQLWAGVKRGKRLMPSATNPNGTEINYTPPDIAEAAYYENLYPEFVDVQKEWIKYNNQLSKYLMDTGVINDEGRKEWIKYGDYIPFYRQMDDEPTIGPKLFQSLTGVKPPKKLKGGSDAPVADFLETIIRNTQSAIQMGIKNTAGQKAVTVALSLNAPGSTDVLEPLSFVSTGDDTITILVNGMKKSFRSQDRLWLQAVTSLNLPDVPFMGIFSKPAQLLRTLVTKEPGFMLANMIRDSMSSHVTSGIGSVNPATTIRNFAAAIAGKSPEFQALFNAGILGGNEYADSIVQSGNKFASDLRKTAGYRTANEKLASPVTGIWEALEKGTTASDAATRMQVYREVLAKTNNEAEAIYRAVEVMNFNRKGNSAIVRVLTASIPFLNARIQGLDVFYRAAFGKGINQQSADAIQKQFFIRGATMMAMSCMYWALTHDDDEYKKQEQETKDNYWLLPSLGIKLPIPFEVGILFKVIPERIMALTFGKDTNKDFTESMVRQLSGTLSLNPIPQAAKPFVEYATNYNFFTGRPLVGQGMEGVESGYQTGPNTSGIATDIGRATGISPLKLDHLLGGFTGTMGMYAFSLMDSIYKINNDSTDASKRFEQSPVIKRFLLDPEARGTVSAYYEIKNSTDAAVRTSGLLERTMNFKEWGPYYKDNIKLLATKDYMLDLEKTMKEFREMKLLIRASKMEPDQKRDALLNITKAENKLTANIQVIKKNID